jgi:hypothetical protein
MTSRHVSTFREVELEAMMIFSKFISTCGAAAIAVTIGLGLSGANAADKPGPAMAADDKADVAPVKSEAPAAAAEQTAQPAQEEATDAASPAAESVTADQLKVGAAVFGADGAKIGELNRVTSNASGKVEEIRVTAGGEAGLNAKVFAVPADKITAVQDGVRLSLSSDEAKKLPIIDNGNG